VPQEVKEERQRRVDALHERIAVEQSADLLRTTVEVLIEDTQSARRDVLQWRSRTRTGKLVYIPRGEENLRGKLIAVRIEKASPWALQGVPA
jgi:tRNA-2-methylthio-N6-dimethylallyladenosine synthase